MKKIGFVVNPVAGIGGRVGLKGSDGEEVLKKAIELGAVPESGEKALITMKLLKEAKAPAEIYTCPGDMGENVCKAAGLSYIVINTGITYGNRTVPGDTIQAAKVFGRMGMDLILFAGGDGTARDIMDAVGMSSVVLGIPAGCKIHSGVYALNPRRAGELAIRYAQGKVRETREAEVMDIDEEQFRKGRVQSRLYGYLKIPYDIRLVQNLKSGSRYSERESLEGIAEYVADTWERDTLYIVGGGTTTECIMKRLHLKNTLLGVDLVYNDQVVASDCTEREILDFIEKSALGNGRIRLLVTVIGGQGYIFGRGNQQISADVIRKVGKENIIVAASRDKMLSFFGKILYVDTGDEEVNRYLTGYMRVIVGYGEYAVIKVSD